MAFGSELSHAAFSFGAGSFALAGIYQEEILGVRLQVLQMDAVILGFCLLIVRIGRFRRLAKIIGVSSIADNAAAAGVRGPGNDRPSRSGALNARAVSDFNRLCSLAPALVPPWRKQPELLLKR